MCVILKSTQIEYREGEWETKPLQTKLNIYLAEAGFVADSVGDYRRQTKKFSSPFQVNSIRSLQALLTRKLSAHLAFYKQNIRIFTSSIYGTSRSIGHMFVSSEDAAARRS
jgi:hypothetical protein